MSSITNWMRLEPHSRTADMEAGLEMRVHDPLWMLARQWQFGEFQGEDTGSPVWAAYHRTEMPIALYLPGPIAEHQHDDVQKYSPALPLEYVVEAENTLARDVMTANRRLAVEAGRQFMRLLGEPLVTEYRDDLLKYSVKALTDAERSGIDAADQAYLDLVAERVLDGVQLLEVIEKSPPAEAALELGFASNHSADAARAITAWVKWCKEMVGPVGSAVTRSSWNPQRMEYACALAVPNDSAGEQIVLTAAEYPGGHLDWYSFDALPTQKLKRDIGIRPESITAATLPTALSFRGLPANRLWEFEDTQVRFGAIQSAPTDLARMLLVEFLIEYGNDFFTIPIELAEGMLHRVGELTITNSFGDEVTRGPFADENWRMHTLSSDSASAARALSSTLFLPTVLGQHLASPPIEQVYLLRDEMANLAWAVERLVESKCGRPLSRHEAYHQQQKEQTPPVAEGTLRYLLDTWSSSSPDFWIPLLLVLPEQSVPGQSPTQLRCHDPQQRSKGRLLPELAQRSQSLLFDDEVPRAGAHVTRTYQYTRWYDGGLFVWIGREKRIGRGEGSSGLRYDDVEVVKVA